jgi:hypothetical protein
VHTPALAAAEVAAAAVAVAAAQHCTGLLEMQRRISAEDAAIILRPINSTAPAVLEVNINSLPVHLNPL